MLCLCAHQEGCLRASYPNQPSPSQEGPDDGTPQGEARQENVRELLSVAQEYQEMGLDGFLEEVALVSDLDSADFTGDAVTLMT